MTQIDLQRPPTQAQTGAERAASALFRLYPFLTGCASLANRPISRAFVPQRPRAVWARVRAAWCSAPLNDLVGRTIFLFGDLDRKVTWVIDRAVGKGDSVGDVGANLGVESLLMAQIVGPAGRVYSFEPSPPTLVHLERTLARNPDLPITLHKFALGAEVAELVLSVPANNAGEATFHDLTAEAGVEAFRVPVKTLASVLTAAAAPRLALLKLDVEGFEAEVLQGLFAPGTITPPATVVLEEHNPGTSRAFDLLRANGYRLFGVPRRFVRLRLVPQDMPGFADCGDFVALHDTAPAAVLRALHVQ
jgi:FkbM family methyltransferase